jgi:putative transposase
VEIQQTAGANTGPNLGVDVGIKELAIVSDGRRFANHGPLTAQLRKLKRRSRKARRKQPGSKHRVQANLKVARLHDESACVRGDAHHKLTTAIARACRAVGLEDLRVKGMLANRKLARAVADAGSGRLYPRDVWIDH